MLLERFEPVLPDRNPSGLNPALLTFDEYHKLVNDKGKWHPDRAYDVSVDRLNQQHSTKKADYTRLYRRVKIHGLKFEIRLYRPPADAVLESPQEWGLGVFDGDTRVATVQDEWGCLLVMVAQEYRGFGLGPMLVRIARTIQPDRPSGGFSPSGYNNFVKVYQGMVRDALASGLYHRLVTQGQMTMPRVHAIIASAKLPKRATKPVRDLGGNDPKSWLLYVGEYGDFVVYDRKLRDLFDGEENDYFLERMMKGYAYVQMHDAHGEDWAMLRQFGADTPAIKTFLINCAVQLTNVETMALYLEPDEIAFVDKRMVERVEDSGPVRGFKSYKVIPTGEVFDYAGMGATERHWRKPLDRYDEFRIRMLELAHSKFQWTPPASDRRGA